MRKHRLGALLLLCCAVLSVGAKPPNLVLFVADDLSPDAGCYGNAVVKTPHLDRLAAEGTRFTHAFCTTASCSPSRSVLLSGQHNHANGQYGLEHATHHFRAHEKLRTLPVLLKEGGYRTARIGKFHVAPEDTFKFETVLKGQPRNPVEMADACKDLIAAKDDKPFFLYFCTADPHRSGQKDDKLPGKPDRFGNRPQGWPGVETVTYDPDKIVVPPYLPDTPTCRQELAQYYQSISRVDQGLGRLVKNLKDAGRWDDTLIVFLSDHGIAFPGAKTTVYDPGLRCPCVVRSPEQMKRGVVNDAMISWVDITPTLLDAAGALPKKHDFHGRSFMPILAQEKTEGWDRIFASHTLHEVTMYYPMRAVRTRQYKLIWNLASPLQFPFAADLWDSATWQDFRGKGPNALYGKRTARAYRERPAFELYDLSKDPHEIHNLVKSPDHDQPLENLKRALQEFQEKTKDPWIVKWERE